MYASVKLLKDLLMFIEFVLDILAFKAIVCVIVGCGIYVFRVVLETDPNVIAGKVAMQSTEASGSLSEQVTTITASLYSLWFSFGLANVKLGFTDINSSTGNSSGTSGKKSAYMSFLVSIACPHIIEWTSNFCEEYLSCESLVIIQTLCLL